MQQTNEQPQTEQDILLSVWREAGRNPDGLTVPCGNESDARRLRFTLYNALKPIKTGKLTADSALKYAIDNCSLSFTDDKCGLVLRSKVSTKLNKTLLSALGNRPVTKLEDAMLGEAFARIASIEPEVSKPTGLEVPNRASLYGARS